MMSIHQKAALYLKLVTRQQDEHGFIHSDQCDSLLFTCLAACAGMKADVWAAHDGKVWHRRPLTLEPCCPNHSKSSISRDMLLGVLWLAFANNDKTLTNSVLSQMHRVVMGKWVGLVGLSRVIPSPGLYATSRILRRRQEGKGPGLWRFVPAVSSTPQEGYLAHLQALHLALRVVCTGRIKMADRLLLLRLYVKNPNNPLFTALVSGPYACIALLSNNRLWPEYGLPTNKDRAPPWLPERADEEYVRDQEAPTKYHSGMDLNFSLWIALLWASLNSK